MLGVVHRAHRRVPTGILIDGAGRGTASSQSPVTHMNLATFNFSGFFGYFRFIGSGPEGFGERRT